MSQVTILSIPKPFRGHIATIQNNALGSWARLAPAAEVMIFGDEEGVSEAAERAGAIHVFDVEKTEFGTPLLDSIFRRAESMSRTPLLCYVNADIIFRADFIEALQAVPFDRFLMVGRRWDADISDTIDFSDPDVDRRVLEMASARSSLGGIFGIDYFAFPRGIPWEFPAFAVGRPGWDNWFVYRAKRLRIPVVDASEATVVIHQNHGYEHVPEARGSSHKGPEGDRNWRLADNLERMFTTFDATHRLTPSGIMPARDFEHLRARVLNWPLLHPALRPPYRRVLALLRRLRNPAL